MNNMLTILLYIMNVVGLAGWGFLTMLLMEVTICKDAHRVNAHRILNKNITARIRLFKRSFRDVFYRATVCLFLGSILGVSIMLNHLYFGTDPTKGFMWATFSVVTPWSIVIIYQNLGYRWTVFEKFKEYLISNEN